MKVRAELWWGCCLMLGLCGILNATAGSPGAGQNSTAPEGQTADLSFLRAVAGKVLESARVPTGASIPGGTTNTSGISLRVPGGTQNYYPAFWVRDAAMMLGGDFVPA